MKLVVMQFCVQEKLIIFIEDKVLITHHVNRVHSLTLPYFGVVLLVWQMQLITMRGKSLQYFMIQQEELNGQNKTIGKKIVN